MKSCAGHAGQWSDLCGAALCSPSCKHPRQCELLMCDKSMRLAYHPAHPANYGRNALNYAAPKDALQLEGLQHLIQKEEVKKHQRGKNEYVQRLQATKPWFRNFRY